MKKILFLILFLAPIFCLQANDMMSYIITKDKDTVGQLTVNSFQIGDTIVYQYQSEATVRFFGSHHVVSSKVCKYVHGKMVSAVSIHYENGDLRDSVTLHWRGSYYDVYENGSNKKQSDLVNWGTISMFFAKPVGKQTVFAEKNLEFQELTLTANNHYQANGGWGKKNQYYYNNSGKLVRAEFNNPLIDFEIHLVGN